MELAHFGRGIGKDALKEPHRGGDHQGEVPVLRGQAPADGLLRLLLAHGNLVGGVVFQNRFLPQDLPVLLGGLVDDAGVRDGHHHPPQAVAQGMLKGEGQTASGFPSSRGNGEAEKAWGKLRGLVARLVDLPPNPVHKGVARVG